MTGERAGNLRATCASPTAHAYRLLMKQSDTPHGPPRHERTGEHPKRYATRLLSDSRSECKNFLLAARHFGHWQVRVAVKSTS